MPFQLNHQSKQTVKTKTKKVMLTTVLSFCAPAYPVSAGVGTPSPLATPTAVVLTTAGKFLCLSVCLCLSVHMYFQIFSLNQFYLAVCWVLLAFVIISGTFFKNLILLFMCNEQICRLWNINVLANVHICVCLCVQFVAVYLCGLCLCVYGSVMHVVFICILSFHAVCMDKIAFMCAEVYLCMYLLTAICFITLIINPYLNNNSLLTAAHYHNNSLL